jgi:hypothetical protein
MKSAAKATPFASGTRTTIAIGNSLIHRASPPRQGYVALYV